MTSAEVLEELKAYGQESIRKVLQKHNLHEPLWGVKIEDMKKIQKKIKKDHELSLELFKSGVYDAMYFAGLIADEKKITKSDLQYWVKNAKSQGISEYTVPWIAAESKYGYELGMEWIDSAKADIASSGWAALCSVVALKDDKDLDMAAIKKLLKRVETEISKAPNRVKYQMNNFVISVGAYIISLNEAAKQTAKKIGKVEVDMGDTACKIPLATEYIAKIEARGTVGKKKKMARC